MCGVVCIAGVVFGVARVRAPQRGANHEHDPTPVSASAMINKKTDTSTVKMGKKEQVPARAIFVQGSLWVCGRRLAGVVLPTGD